MYMRGSGRAVGGSRSRTARDRERERHLKRARSARGWLGAAAKSPPGLTAAPGPTSTTRLGGDIGGRRVKPLLAQRRVMFVADSSIGGRPSRGERAGDCGDTNASRRGPTPPSRYASQAIAPAHPLPGGPRPLRRSDFRASYRAATRSRMVGQNVPLRLIQGEVSEWPKERDWKSRTC
jgi:hypothetical protein